MIVAARTHGPEDGAHGAEARTVRTTPSSHGGLPRLVTLGHPLSSLFLVGFHRSLESIGLFSQRREEAAQPVLGLPVREVTHLRIELLAREGDERLRIDQHVGRKVQEYPPHFERNFGSSMSSSFSNLLDHPKSLLGRRVKSVARRNCVRTTPGRCLWASPDLLSVSLVRRQAFPRKVGRKPRSAAAHLA